MSSTLSAVAAIERERCATIGSTRSQKSTKPASNRRRSQSATTARVRRPSRSRSPCFRRPPTTPADSPTPGRVSSRSGRPAAHSPTGTRRRRRAHALIRSSPDRLCGSSGRPFAHARFAKATTDHRLPLCGRSSRAARLTGPPTKTRGLPLTGGPPGHVIDCLRLWLRRSDATGGRRRSARHSRAWRLRAWRPVARRVGT